MSGARFLPAIGETEFQQHNFTYEDCWHATEAEVIFQISEIIPDFLHEINNLK